MYLYPQFPSAFDVDGMEYRLIPLYAFSDY